MPLRSFEDLSNIFVFSLSQKANLIILFFKETKLFCTLETYYMIVVVDIWIYTCDRAA